MIGKRAGKTTRQEIFRYQEGKTHFEMDLLATEEPLEIRLGTEEKNYESLSVTMRTPGNDFELVVGFLFSEGALKSAEDIVRISYCTKGESVQKYNILRVLLRNSVSPELFSRHVYTHSSCGVCGKTSLDSLQFSCPQKPQGNLSFSASFLTGLPHKLALEQGLFSKTGGVHAAALFDQNGELLLVREDVGRHNAMDKILGHLLLENLIPASNKILLLSGRASFELLQKAIQGGIPFVASLGAPSNLAVELAQSYGVTLIGFLKKDSFNVYSGQERLLSENL